MSDRRPDSATVAVRIVIADDHAITRRGVRMLLDGEPGFTVVAEAVDAGAALREVRRHRPGVLVLDITLSGRSSLATMPELLAASPGTRIVVLTMHDEPHYVREALRAGVLGYVLKEAADGELVEAVRRAAAGEQHIDPRFQATVGADFPSVATGLTDREGEVLRLLALGHTNPEIAGRLDVSVRTVESHRSHIQHKLGLSTRSGLVRYALDRGWLEI